MTEHLRAVWPIADPTRSAPSLISEALADLPNVARMRGVRPIGRPRIAIRPGADVPGCGGAQVAIVADVAAERIREGAA